MYEILFLIILTGIYLIIASILDFKTREVPNWLSFSLIIFALVFRAFYSAYSGNWMFFVYGLIGFGLFFILAYLFYYARVFAGGDAKLLMGLGAALPIISSIEGNFLFLFSFIFLIIFVGGIYGMVYSFVLVSFNKDKFYSNFVKELKKKRSLFTISRIFAILSFFLIIFFKESTLLVFPILFFVFPYLFVYAKATENVCMIKKVSIDKLTIGDWLFEKVKVGDKVINPNWEGLSEKELKLLGRLGNKKVKVKYGIPFVPCFLISFALLIFLWYSYWSLFQFFWF